VCRDSSALLEQREHLKVRLARPVQSQQQIVHDGHREEQVVDLVRTSEAPVQPLVGGEFGYPMLAQEHVAAGGRQLTAYHVQERGLAGAVGSDHGQLLAGLDAKGDTF
jgi:hypothetical protein